MPAPNARFNKPKRAKFHDDREAKVFENNKTAVFFKAKKTSQTANDFLTLLYKMKAPEAVKLNAKFDIRPFEDDSEIERISVRRDTSLFCIASHSKKRPNDIILGRCFDHHVLDMMEFGITSFTENPTGNHVTSLIAPGTRPCLTFIGQEFENSEDLKRYKNVMIDFLKGSNTRRVDITGLHYLVAFVALPNKRILMTTYSVFKKKTTPKTTAVVVDEEEQQREDTAEKLLKLGLEITNKAPELEVEEVGPRVEFEIRRTRFASESVMEMAMKTPQELRRGHGKDSRQKNVEYQLTAGRVGTVYPRKQQLDHLSKSVRLPKSLRHQPGEAVKGRPFKKPKH